MTDHPDDLDESTLRGSRRPRSASPEMEIEETVLVRRRRADHEVPDETLLSVRPRGADPAVPEAVSDEVPDDTVLSVRPRGADPAVPQAVSDEVPDDTLLSSRERDSHTDADDDTIAVPRRRTGVDPSAPVGDEDPILRWSQVSSNDERRPVTPQRTPMEPLVDDPVRRRVASTPEPAILRAPYRPRAIETAPVNRLEPVAREPRDPVNTVAADARRRADSRRTLIAVIAVGGVIVLAGLAGIIAILTGLL